MANDFGKVLGLVFMLILFAIVLIQGVSYAVTSIFNVPLIKLGVFFYMLSVAGAAFIGLAIAKRLFLGEKVEKGDWLALIIGVVILGFIFFKLPELIPQIFSVQDVKIFNNQVFSVVGFK